LSAQGLELPFGLRDGCRRFAFPHEIERPREDGAIEGVDPRLDHARGRGHPFVRDDFRIEPGRVHAQDRLPIGAVSRVGIGHRRKGATVNGSPDAAPSEWRSSRPEAESVASSSRGGVFGRFRLGTRSSASLRAPTFLSLLSDEDEDAWTWGVGAKRGSRRGGMASRCGGILEGENAA
jgi:hypothetical protein